MNYNHDFYSHSFFLVLISTDALIRPISLQLKNHARHHTEPEPSPRDLPIRHPCGDGDGFFSGEQLDQDYARSHSGGSRSMSVGRGPEWDLA
jgi:hypothetical protein